MMKRPAFFPRTKAANQAGFTIVELMIATAVFSLVLMVILYGVLSFSHAYFSGVNSSNTQDTARSIINSISQAVEFSGNIITPTTNVSGNTYYFCAGGSTYYYTEGQMYPGGTPSLANPGLYVVPGSCTSPPTFPTAGAKELLSANMRVAYLRLTPAPGSSRLYTVELDLSYGDSDVLCNISKNGSGASPGGCLPGDALYSPGASVKGASVDDVVCKQVTGSQFCAHAGLATTVSLRVDSSELTP